MSEQTNSVQTQDEVVVGLPSQDAPTTSHEPEKPRNIRVISKTHPNLLVWNPRVKFNPIEEEVDTPNGPRLEITHGEAFVNADEWEALEEIQEEFQIFKKKK